MHFFLLIVFIFATFINARYHRLRHIRLENSFCNGYQELKDGNCISRLNLCSNLTSDELTTMRQILCGFRYNTEVQTDPSNVQNVNETEWRRGHYPYVDVYETNAHSYPWLASIYSEDRRFLCSGALISPQVIITSAQCVSQSSDAQMNEDFPKLIVRFGEHHLNSSSSFGNVYEYDVESMEISEQYDQLTHQNDLMIVKLVSRVPICLFPPIHIPRKHEWLDINRIEGCFATYIGWGLAHERSHLRKLSGHVLSQDFCQTLFNWDKNQLNKTHLCVDSPHGKCVSNIGGPLITYANNHWVLIGIMTFGKHCRTPGLPLVFTRISEFIEDISELIEEDFKSNNISNSSFDECYSHRHVDYDIHYI